MSSTKLPPEPKADREMNSPRTIQFGDAPASIAKIELIINEKLKANRLPIRSADSPQNKAPTNCKSAVSIAQEFVE